MSNLVNMHQSPNGQMNRCEAKVRCPFAGATSHVPMTETMAKSYNELAVEEEMGGVFGDGLSSASSQKLSSLRSHMESVRMSNQISAIDKALEAGEAARDAHSRGEITAAEANKRIEEANDSLAAEAGAFEETRARSRDADKVDRSAKIESLSDDRANALSKLVVLGQELEAAQMFGSQEDQVALQTEIQSVTAASEKAVADRNALEEESLNVIRNRGVDDTSRALADEIISIRRSCNETSARLTDLRGARGGIEQQNLPITSKAQAISQIDTLIEEAEMQMEELERSSVAAEMKLVKYERKMNP